MSDQNDFPVPAPVPVISQVQIHTDPDVAYPGCPWGKILDIETVEPGVMFVTTARHHGYHLSAQAQLSLPERYRKSWYEEDYEAALVAYFLGWASQARARLILDAHFAGWSET